MFLRNQLRPTMIRTNARFRGPTEIEKYHNMVLEAIHDMKLLGTILDGNEMAEPEVKGHSDYIYENFSAYVSGTTLDGEIPKVASHIASSSVLYYPIGEVFPPRLDLMDPTVWSTSLGVTRQLTNGVVRLHSQALTDPAGIYATKQVEEGDIIYIRLGIKVISGTIDTFAIGSRNINQGQGDMTKFQIPKNGSTIYIDKRLYCQHRESITINIDLHNIPNILAPVEVEIVHPMIVFLREQEVGLTPMMQLKSKVRHLEEQLNHLLAE